MTIGFRIVKDLNASFPTTRIYTPDGVDISRYVHHVVYSHRGGQSPSIFMECAVSEIDVDAANVKVVDVQQLPETDAEAYDNAAIELVLLARIRELERELENKK